MSKDGIDFNKLNQEFNKAKEDDLKYSRENDAKFRAVNQNVGSYEEFRDIVSGSHLQPLERDSITKIKSTSQPWNTVLIQSHDKHDDNVTPLQDDCHKSTMNSSSIKTRDQFMKEWQNAVNKVGYILSFDITFIRFVFKCDIPCNFLEKTVEGLLSEITSCDDVPIVVDLLKAFTYSERFSLTVNFLNKKDKENIKKLFQEIDKCGILTKELQSLYNL